MPSPSRRHDVFSSNALPSAAARGTALRGRCLRLHPQLATAASASSARRRSALRSARPSTSFTARPSAAAAASASSARRPCASRFALCPSFRELRDAAFRCHRRRRLCVAQGRSALRSVRPPLPPAATSLVATCRPPPRRGPLRPSPPSAARGPLRPRLSLLGAAPQCVVLHPPCRELRGAVFRDRLGRRLPFGGGLLFARAGEVMML